MKSRIAGLFMLLLLAGCAPTQAPEATTEAESPTSATEEAAAAPTEAPESALTLTDGTGTVLTFDHAPERIICLYSRCMELLAALELAPVGVSTYEEPFATNPAYFPQPSETVIIEYDGDNPNIEQIAALEPDLVLAWEELRAPLEGIAPVYSVINEQDSYEESHDEIRTFAALLGREEIAEANIQAALDRLEAYKRLSPRNLSVMYGFMYDGAFYYRDGASGTCNLFNEVAMCEWPDPANASSWSVEVNDEGLLQLNPGIILIDSYGFEEGVDVVAEVSARPLWGELDAVKNGRVFISSDEVANLDGMGTVGMAQMLDYYMPLFYPDVFPTALTDEQVQEALSE